MNVPRRVKGIVVVHFGGRHYVMRETDDILVDREAAIHHIAQTSSRWTTTREKALLLAHDINNAVRADRGVRELFTDETRRKRSYDDTMALDDD